MNGHPPVEPFVVVPVDSWRSFADTVNNQIGELNAGSFVFRGQPDSSWFLESLFDRKFRRLAPQQRIRVNDRISDIFRTTAERAEFQVPETDPELWSLGQHHGLATRMLDWTESRYVAAFFAFSALAGHFNSSLEAEQEPSGRCVGVFALDARSPLWSSDSIEVQRVRLIGPNERIRRQRGLFTMNRTQFLSVESFVADYCANNPDEIDRAALYRFDIPVQEVRVALRDLNEMRISHSELFPGLDGVARETMLNEWLNGI